MEILDSGSTDFFSTLGIADGTYNSENDIIRAGVAEVVDSSDLIAEYVKTYRTRNLAQNVETQTVKTVDAEMASTLVHLMAKSMNALFDDSGLSSAPTAKTEEIRNNVRSAISASFNSDGPQFKTDFGIHFDFSRSKNPRFCLMVIQWLRKLSQTWSPCATINARSAGVIGSETGTTASCEWA